METPRAFASSTVRRMMSASPAWYPQAMLTELASSIIAASLPISQGPKLSPRSQFRSMVVIGVSVQFLIRCQYICLGVPGPDVDRADRTARDISISKCLHVEFDPVDRAKAIGQGAQEPGDFPG